jgi:hypothetical protein
MGSHERIWQCVFGICELNCVFYHTVCFEILKVACFCSLHITLVMMFQYLGVSSCKYVFAVIILYTDY